ncbi:MAG: YbaK/EbsC family protein [Armatimonadota bacterium]|nr:YbaK/EbsC family protein [Armatimonadota bacterium]MDR7485459.1 YbaK/EbsC family protein [Armatimonadota bacterium]MDR7533004.1 YbaK/EbsC family protein [Armatimonadota bacterium]MDR7536824.1 YbaK/EbsC family protein [Armatimonadota bacterium]
MTCRERLEQMFRNAQVAYRVTPHPPAFTAQEIAAAEHVSGYEVAKVVMALADDRLVMLVLPAPYRVDLVRLKQQLGAAAVRLAHEREFANVFPDCEVGAMPPFGNLYNIPVYVDRALTADREITFNAGSHRETMTVAYADFERLAQPTVLEFARGPR